MSSVFFPVLWVLIINIVLYILGKWESQLVKSLGLNHDIDKQNVVVCLLFLINIANLIAILKKTEINLCVTLLNIHTPAIFIRRYTVILNKDSTTPLQLANRRRGKICGVSKCERKKYNIVANNFHVKKNGEDVYLPLCII